jgi:hypothetical protein
MYKITTYVWDIEFDNKNSRHAVDQCYRHSKSEADKEYQKYIAEAKSQYDSRNIFYLVYDYGTYVILNTGDNGLIIEITECDSQPEISDYVYEDI